MTALLDDHVPAQFAIWGYAITGDACEIAALAAECRPGDSVAEHEQLWDKTAAGLAGQLVSHGNGPYRRVKDWAALPWVTEHLIRHDLPWPGL